MDKLLYAALLINSPTYNKLKLSQIDNLNIVIEFLKYRDAAMYILPCVNEELCIKIQKIKQTIQPYKILNLIQEGHEILSKIRVFRPKLRSLCNKVKQIPTSQLKYIKQVIYSVRVEPRSMSEQYKQLDKLNELYNEFKQLIQNNKVNLTIL